MVFLRISRSPDLPMARWPDLPISRFPSDLPIHNPSVLLYRVLSALALLAYSPVAIGRALLGRRDLGDVRGRLGLTAYPDLEGGVWVHAVSVGEVGVARTLLATLERHAPERRRGLSVTTAAGRRLAQSLPSSGAPVFAFPFDLAGPVERALDSVRPGLVLLTETEIWPLFLERAARRGIPVALVNGRVSLRSFSRYRLVRGPMAESLARIALFAMQSAADAERIEALGAPSGRIAVTGNVKYDTPEAPPFADAVRLRAAAAGRAIFVAASTAEGEEAVVLEAWRRLERRPLLVLAPRRPERFDSVASLVEKSGLSILRRSSSSITNHQSPIANVVYLLDSIGELASLYREAQLAFIGGSFVPVGGHNPIEAWSAGVPVLVGPHTENFRDIVADGEARGLAKRVSGEAALARELARALASAPGVSPAGDAARRFVAESRGAAERTAAMVLALLELAGAAEGGSLIFDPFSRLYGSLVEARARLYATGRLRSRRLPYPTISVGNITLGGTGKTPVVEWLARRFRFEGRRPAILSRGYGRRSRGVVVVSEGDGPLVDADRGGDEPVELARRLPGVLIVAAERRAEGAAAAARLGADLFLLDDGFQHLAVQRDVNLLLLDARDPFGGGELPAPRAAPGAALGPRPRRRLPLHARGPRRAAGAGAPHPRRDPAGGSRLLGAHPRRGSPGRGRLPGPPVGLRFAPRDRRVRGRQSRRFRRVALGARARARGDPRFPRSPALRAAGARPDPAGGRGERGRVGRDHRERRGEALGPAPAAGRRRSPRRRDRRAGIRPLPRRADRSRPGRVSDRMRTSPSAVFDDGAVRLARRGRARGSSLRFAAEHGVFLAVAGALRLLPKGAGPALGRRIAPPLLRLSRRRVRLLIENLSRAFPQKGRDEIRRIARDSVANLGAALFEFLEVSRWSADDVRARVSYEGVENLEAARARGRGVILLSAHFGSWEMGALAAGLLGEPISSVVRPLDNPRLEAELAARRTRFGNRVIAKKEALREMLRAVRGNETVAILLDQNVMPGEAVFVPFFGRLAATTPSVALLQRKTGAAVVPVFTHPSEGGRWRLRFETPILAEEFAGNDGGRTEQVRLATARYTEVTEAAVREQPEAWLWLHDRWKTRPSP